VAKKGKETGISKLLWDEVDPYGAVLGKPVSKPIERFPLEAVRPDPEQPRRLLPSDLAEAVNQGEMEPPVAMSEWVKRAEANTDSMIAQEMRELQRLASAIEQHGLINPITIRPSGPDKDRFVIVTGERRYWAQILLSLEGRRIQEGEVEEVPDRIKATLVAPGVSIRAHQIVENLMREDINVVEKAHGLLALRRELTNDAHGRHSDAEKGKKPRMVSWKQVEDALDLSRQYRARIVAVLDLSEEAQELVDRYNLSERTIRPVVEKLKKSPDLQVQALRQLIAWQETEAKGEGGGRRIVPSVQALVDKLLAAKEATVGRRAPAQGLDFGKFRQRVRGTLRYMQNLDEAAMTEFTRILDNEAGAEIVEELQALRNQIDEMLTALSEERSAS
jgi:ParB-like chromosome segregation protein Spo0J